MQRLLLRIAGGALVTVGAVVFASAIFGGTSAQAGNGPAPTPDPCIATPTFQSGVIQAFQAPPTPTACATEGPPKTHTPTPQTPTSTPEVTNTPPPPSPPPAATSTPAGGAGGGVTPPDTGTGGAAADTTPLAALALAAAMMAAGGATLAAARKVSR